MRAHTGDGSTGTFNASDSALLSEVVDFYRAALPDSPAASACLARLGLTDPTLPRVFHLGCADRSRDRNVGNLSDGSAIGRHSQVESARQGGIGQPEASQAALRAGALPEGPRRGRPRSAGRCRR